MSTSRAQQGIGDSAGKFHGIGSIGIFLHIRDTPKSVGPLGRMVNPIHSKVEVEVDVRVSGRTMAYRRTGVASASVKLRVPKGYTHNAAFKNPPSNTSPDRRTPVHNSETCKAILITISICTLHSNKTVFALTPPHATLSMQTSNSFSLVVSCRFVRRSCLRRRPERRPSPCVSHVAACAEGGLI